MGIVIMNANTSSMNVLNASHTHRQTDTHYTYCYYHTHTDRRTYTRLETDRNSVSVFRPKPPKNMVSAWFRLWQKGTVELRFPPKLDHVETETSRNWISSVSCSDLQSDDVIFQKQSAGLTAWSESSHVHSASPPQLENRKYFL